MTSVGKVTVSLPAELLAHIEERRREISASRSEVVSDLLWRGWHQIEEEDREARYRAAYHAQPETAGELEWAEMAADELFVADHDNSTKPDITVGRHRRAAR